jgi:UPF0716 protein FxsA
MIVAKWLLLAVLALPAAEIAVFILVALQIGFGWALAVQLAASLLGALVLRHAGGSHIARMRVVLGPQRITALQADSAGTLSVVAGILLLIPGFITDILGLLLLIGPLRRALGAGLRRAADRPATPADTVVDLAPEDWRQMPDAKLTDDRARNDRR